MAGEKKKTSKFEEFREKAHRIIDELPPEDLPAVAAVLEEIMIGGCEDAVKSGTAEMLAAERREYVRLRARVPIAYKTLDQPALQKRTSSLDISGGGLSFILWSGDRVRAGDFIEIRMVLPGKKGVITAQAEIIRVSPSPGGKGYKVGVEFLHITDQQRRQINDFISEYANTSGK